jgi:sterol desaturase/sphingolipid hydroxylase (fatty acid hydroxylase superfamily)
MYFQIALTISGFFFTSLMFYFNHRFVGHGSLGKLPILKHMRRLHMIHHRNDYNENRNKHLVLPIWGKIIFLSIFAIVSLLSFSFALGYISYVIYYGWLHHKIHNDDQTGLCSRHHFIHHRKSARHNFSGTMPFIDRIFGTYYKKSLDKDDKR